jgi:hypothetical protein
MIKINSVKLAANQYLSLLLRKWAIRNIAVDTAKGNVIPLPIKAVIIDIRVENANPSVIQDKTLELRCWRIFWKSLIQVL